MTFPATVDLSRQPVTLQSYPGLDVSVWFQDALFQALITSGLIRGIISDTEPTDTRKLWYKVENPPSGSPGTPWKYDVVAETWVALTPEEFIDYLSVYPRIQIFSQASAPTTAQAAQPGDMWFRTTNGRMHIYTPVAANVVVWLDVSGAALNLGTSNLLNPKGTWNASTNSPTITSGVGTNGDVYIVSTAGSTTIDGISSWAAQDWLIFLGSTWHKLEGSIGAVDGGSP